ncbi:MAG: hypothetical protein II776_01925 [Clostridia bacterium]|nr:hypothetical protein [Clostridia bacterium]
MKGKGKTVLILLIWTAILGGVYLAFAGTPAGVFVSMVYAVAGSVLFVFFLLVNGGFRSLPGEERAAAEKGPAKDLRGKKKRAPEPEPSSPAPRPDFFRLGREKQEKAAKILLALSIPFFFILVFDWFYLHFIFKG